tara:strand:- start:2039 stop:2683 length:645 start_codon:yes stop_codon:yes gene_type:complete
MLIFLLLFFLKMAHGVVHGVETSAILFCVPHTLKINAVSIMLSNIQDCLSNNFIRLQNVSVVSTYVAAYNVALTAKLASEEAVDALFLSKHEMTITMRDLRIQASRHIHAVESCAAISHRMPSIVVDMYTDEAAMMFQVSKLWMHHIQVDLNRCYDLMKQIVTNSHRHAIHHLQTLFIKHKHLLVHSEDQSTKEIETLQDMLDVRQVIVDSVNT